MDGRKSIELMTAGIAASTAGAPLAFGQRSNPSSQRMVRTKTHKLIVYPQIRRVQVFDLEKDPWEMDDLTENPQAAPVKVELMQRLLRIQQELGDKLSLTSFSQG